jgi:hypothetical protein
MKKEIDFNYSEGVVPDVGDLDEDIVKEILKEKIKND